MTTPKTALQVAKSGPLVGSVFANLDYERLVQFKNDEYKKHVDYVFGGKDPTPGDGKVDFDGIDCSGDVRTILMYVTHGLLGDIPDGSFLEHEYLARKGFRAHPCHSANDVAITGLKDNLVRCAVHYPGGRNGDSTGHIALFVNGHSIESYGGHGPGERPWDHGWFLQHWDVVYTLGPMVKEWAYP